MSEPATNDGQNWLGLRELRASAGLLALVLALVTAATTWTYFNYPLEVECMEASNWVEALAIREGRSPYRDPGLAFMNMNHGPFDAPAKALISRALPWLEPWQIIRLPGLLLPLLLVLALRTRGVNPSALSWRWSIVAGLAAYFIIQSTGNMVANMGRSDALMLGLLTLLVPCAVNVFTADQRVRLGWAAAGGAIAAAAFLQNFRTALVVPSIALTLAYDWRRDCFRPRAALLGCLGAAAVGFVAIFAIMLGLVFRFDWVTYYRYSLGFFLSPQAHGLTGLPRLRDLANPFLENQVWLLLPVVGLAALACQPRSRAMWLRVAAFALPFVLFLAAYVKNYVGAAGGLHYFAPLVILALLFWRLTDWNETRHSATLLVVVGAALLACNWRVVANNTAHLFHTRRDAAAFNQFVRDLDQRRSVESQDIHLFQTRLHPTEVDIGFYSNLAREKKSADYFPAYTQAFATHEARMRREPPDVIVVGDFPSEELAARLRAGDYVLIRESPPRIYNAENFTRTHVWARRSIAAEFSVVTNPTPHFRSW